MSLLLSDTVRPACENLTLFLHPSDLLVQDHLTQATAEQTVMACLRAGNGGYNYIPHLTYVVVEVPLHGPVSRDDPAVPIFGCNAWALLLSIRVGTLLGNWNEIVPRGRRVYSVAIRSKLKRISNSPSPKLPNPI